MAARHNVPVTQPATPSGAAQERDRFRDWPTPARYLVYGVLVVVLLLVLALIAATIVIRRPLPQTDGTLTLKGLDRQVQVLRDDHGVPQIYADTSHDLFYAQGFVQAQDRFWLMDYGRHLTAGRLSELFGSRTLGSDMTARTLGWYRTAEREYLLLSPVARDALESFSDGVNAWLASHSGSDAALEYTVLSIDVDYRPEAWTPVDSLAWLKAMAWDLSGNIEDEIARARLSVNRDPAQISELYPAYPYAQHAPITGDRPAARPAALGHGERITRPMLAPLDRVAAANRSMPAAVGVGDGIGSNGWVVAGSHTTSGKPLLANDPHLAVGQPGALYQMGLHCRTVDAACPYDVSGFTWAGFPGIAMGHNADISWGMTNLKADTVDLYLEKVTGTNYLFDDHVTPLEQHDEQIRIAGGGSKLITVRSTRHGPLVSDVSRELSSVG
ncbi:MAG: penicillin amidase, partial [Nocardioidaceae bacterium]|nr:penicillin amidase [Nocardioidaceae bacterium]